METPVIKRSGLKTQQRVGQVKELGFSKDQSTQKKISARLWKLLAQLVYTCQRHRCNMSITAALVGVQSQGEGTRIDSACNGSRFFFVLSIRGPKTLIFRKDKDKSDWVLYYSLRGGLMIPNSLLFSSLHILWSLLSFSVF